MKMVKVRMRAQSSMVLIMIILAMFAGIVIILLGLASTISNEEFTSLYANNLLLSVMRTDAGFQDARCKTVSDLVFCAYFTPEWRCGDSSLPCLETANETIARYMNVFGNETKSLKYLFIIKPAFVSRTEEGDIITLDMGDKSLKSSRDDSLKIFSYPLVVSKTVGSNQYTLKMQLIVSKR